jgi:hypothetical protein
MFPVTLINFVTPLIPLRRIHEDIHFTADEYHNCPAIWNGQCNSYDCPAAEEAEGYECVYEPLIDESDATYAWLRLSALTCGYYHNCGDLYNNTTDDCVDYCLATCPDFEFDIMPPKSDFICPTNGNGCKYEDCEAFWFEGCDAGCSINMSPHWA